MKLSELIKALQDYQSSAKDLGVSIDPEVFIVDEGYGNDTPTIEDVDWSYFLGDQEFYIITGITKQERDRMN